MPTTSHRGKPGSGGGHTTIHDMLEMPLAGQEALPVWEIFG
jgi:hypothetical protein